MNVVGVEYILQNIQYKDWQFEAVQESADIILVRVYFQTGSYQYGRWWVIENDHNVSQVVQTVLKAILTAEEHEAREEFRYHGKRIFGPHIDVNFLSDSVGKKENLALTGK